MTIFTSSRKRYARHIVWVATIAMLAASVEAWGQTSQATQWQRGTTLGALAVSLHLKARRRRWAPRSDGKSTGT
jgi:hypothetical protein